MFGVALWQLQVELQSGRLAVHGKPTARGGYSDLRCTYPSLLEWLGSDMPAATRRRVEKAGGVATLQKWRVEQIELCEIDLVNNTITMPDGTMLTNVVYVPAKAN